MFLSREDFNNRSLVFKLIVSLRCESKYNIAETLYEGRIPDHIASDRSYIAIQELGNGIRLSFGHIAMPHTPPVAEIVPYLFYDNVSIIRFIEIYQQVFGHKPL